MTKLHPTARAFLRELADDSSETHTHLVEDLRCVAAMLDGSYPFDDQTRAAVTPRLARRLREYAQKLCQHVRVQGDRCRYCEIIVSDGCFAEDQAPEKEGT